MKLLRRLLFRSKSKAKDEQLVLVFLPALVTNLLAAAKAKGSPLSEEDVMFVRDNSTCMGVTIPAAMALEKSRGYPDIAPEYVWEEWLAYLKHSSSDDHGDQASPS